jgi:telomerase reverse transcriptase
MRRYETFSLHNFMEKLSLKSICWLAIANSNSFRRIPLSDMNKRKNLFYEFATWMVNDFLIPLIRTSFYITETGPYKNTILYNLHLTDSYFRQDVWNGLTAPAFSKLTTDSFEMIRKADLEAFFASRVFGFSFVRMLPKAGGFRTIINLKRKQVQWVFRIFLSKE